MVNIPGLEAMNWTGVLSTTMYWVGYILAVVLILGFFVVVYYLFSFNYKEYYWELVASGNDAQYAIGKLRKNRIKFSHDGNSWRRLFPLLNNRKYEPYTENYIYVGRNIFSYKLGTDYLPAKINTLSESQSLEISPTPKYLRLWEIAAKKEVDAELSKRGFWEENKTFIIGLVTVAICLVLAGVTIWMSYEFAAGGRADAQMITAAIDNMVVRFT